MQFGKKDEMLKKATSALAEIKDRFPNANIYNPQGVSGTHTIYVLAEKPSVYGLPENQRYQPLPFFGKTMHSQSEKRCLVQRRWRLSVHLSQTSILIKK